MFNKRHIVRTIAATVSILALSFTAACGSGQSTASNSTDSDDITRLEVGSFDRTVIKVGASC